jgi:predicted ATPase
MRLRVVPERVQDPAAYPFSIPAIAALDGLALHPHVTDFVGENGSGKSTLLEGIAVAAGFNAEGGTTNFRFATRSSESTLGSALRLVRSARRPRTGFFLRAESFFNLATTIESLDSAPGLGAPIIGSYGGRSLHEQSHGESFMALAMNRFGAEGFYVLDEPEAALSPLRQMSLLRRMHDLVNQGCQFIVATHAPIVLAYPGAWIYELDERGVKRVAYEETGTVKVTREFLGDREGMIGELFGGGDGGRSE